MMEAKQKQKQEEEEAKEARKIQREENKKKKIEELAQKAEERQRKAAEREKLRLKRETLKKQKAEERVQKKKAVLKPRNRSLRPLTSCASLVTAIEHESGNGEESGDQNVCAVCLGRYEDDLINGTLQNEWICCTNTENCGLWMHFDCLSPEGNCFMCDVPFK